MATPLAIAPWGVSFRRIHSLVWALFHGFNGPSANAAVAGLPARSRLLDTINAFTFTALRNVGFSTSSVHRAPMHSSCGLSEPM